MFWSLIWCLFVGRGARCVRCCVMSSAARGRAVDGFKCNLMSWKWRTDTILVNNNKRDSRFERPCECERDWKVAETCGLNASVCNLTHTRTSTHSHRHTKWQANWASKQKRALPLLLLLASRASSVKWALVGPTRTGEPASSSMQSEAQSKMAVTWRTIDSPG